MDILQILTNLKSEWTLTKYWRYYPGTTFCKTILNVFFYFSSIVFIYLHICYAIIHVIIYL